MHRAAPPRDEASRSRPPRWLRRLRLVGVVLPALAIVLLQLARPLVADRLGARAATLGVDLFSATAAVLFGITMFTLIERGHRMIARRNAELTTVNHLLSTIVDRAPADQVAAEVAAIPQPDERVARRYADLVELARREDDRREQERHAARVEELDRVAREMHDSRAQVLGTVHLRLRVLEGTAGPEMEREVAELADLCHAAYGDVREAILGLRSLTRDDLPLGTTLAAYARDYERQGGPPTTVQGEGEDLPLLPDATRLHLVRIVQEALTNVRKHAGAGQVVVRAERVAEGLRLQVEDDGSGFDTATGCTGGHYGLATMRERADLVGARLDVRSRPGEGTVVEVVVPVDGATVDVAGGVPAARSAATTGGAPA